MWCLLLQHVAVSTTMACPFYKTTLQPAMPLAKHLERRYPSTRLYAIQGEREKRIYTYAFLSFIICQLSSVTALHHRPLHHLLHQLNFHFLHPIPRSPIPRPESRMQEANPQTQSPRKGPKQVLPLSAALWLLARRVLLQGKGPQRGQLRRGSVPGH